MSAHKKQHLTRAKSFKASEATLRDQFALAVLPSFCHMTLDDEGVAGDVARRAYLVADAMLLAREDTAEPEAPPHTHSGSEG